MMDTNRLVEEAMAEAEELNANDLITEKQFNEMKLLCTEEFKNGELLFKHININESFMFITGLYIKVSDTEAIGLYENKIEFEKDKVVSKMKNFVANSFEGGRSKVDFDKAAYVKWKNKRIEKYNQENDE